MDVCAIGELVAAEESITLVQAHGKRADIVVKTKYIKKNHFWEKFTIVQLRIFILNLINLEQSTADFMLLYITRNMSIYKRYLENS